MNRAAAAALFAVGFAGMAPQAFATPITVGFSLDYPTPGTSLASGSFTYDDSLTGVIHFSDLSSFTIDFSASGGGIYSSADLFNYDTNLQTFVFLPTPAGAPYYGLYNALADAGAGWTVYCNNGNGAGSGGCDTPQFTDNAGNLYHIPANASFTFSYTGDPPDPVPEPATIALVGAGLLGLAGLGRRRKAKA